MLRSREQFAVGVLSRDFEHGHFGQRARRGIALLRPTLQCAFLFELFQDAFERNALGPRYTQFARDVALGGVRLGLQSFENAGFVERLSFR